MKNFLPFFGICAGMAIGRTIDLWATKPDIAIYPTIMISITFLLGLFLTVIERAYK